MYTEYSSQNSYQEPDKYEKKSSKANKFFSILWKLLLVAIIFILLFLLLIKFDVISLNSSIAPDAILLNQNEIGIKKGKSYQLISTILPENANNKQVIWTSSNPDIVSVNEVTGYIQGLEVGTAVVTVKTLINDKTNECVVNVTDDNIFVAGITLNDKNINLAVGYTHSLTYRVFPTNATELGLKFTSSDKSVATVNSKGVITGVKEGSAIITVFSSNYSIRDTAYVTVYKKGASTMVNGESLKTENYPKSISLSSESINLTIGSSSQLYAEVLPSDANQKVSWSSDNSKVATVDNDGIVTAKMSGIATIIAKTINNEVATCKVVVGNYSTNLKSVLITTEYATLPVNMTKQLVVSFTPSTATNKTVIWSSNNPKVATVDSNSGLVKAISSGVAIITVKSKDGGYTDETTIEVVDYDNVIEVQNISFKNSDYSIGINETMTLFPIITPSTATYQSTEFISSDPKVATVDENGVVKGLKKGSVTITATTKRNNKKASAVINVIRIPSTGVTLNKTNINLELNDTFSLIADVVPGNATNKNVTYESDNLKVAKIDQNGIITAIGRGQTTITVTPNGGGNPSTCLVIVK